MTWTMKRLLVILGGLLGLLVVAAWKPPEQEPPVPDLSAYPWLYLRAGWPLTDDEVVVELVMVGDVMLGRGVTGQPNPLAEVAPWLRSADLALGNLEGVITEATPTPAERSDAPSCYRLSMPSSAMVALDVAGFDILGLANNHALDFGHQGLADTIVHLETTGIDPLGVTSANDPVVVPLVRESNGVRLAFLAFNVVPYPMGSDSETLEGWTVLDWDQEQAVASIAAGHTQADAVVVFIHWGYEYETRPDPFQRSAAQAMLAAGADLVVGHHPHVVTGETRQGLALRAFFDREGLRAVQALPVLTGPRPQLMPLSQARPLLDRLGVPAHRVGFACSESSTGACLSLGGSGTNRERSGESPGQDAEAVCCPQSDRAVSDTYAKAIAADEACFPVDVPWVATAGPFEAGQIDLTGDGRPERVRLIGDQVVIYPSDEEMPVAWDSELWRSPPEWQVVDVALGDADDDGRGDIMLALWKPGPDEETGTGEAGILRPSHNEGLRPSDCEGLRPSDCEGLRPSNCEGLRSHPFIIGYREGIFRTLWGGSAVARPLHEIELGDVDGDGMQELIVLEDGGPDGDRTVSVWRWHGWGFSLLWRSPPQFGGRSPPGRYHDLVLMLAQGGCPALISVAE
jgi:hypothetical protein